MAGLLHGCPVVTTRPAFLQQDLVDGETVRLIPPEEPEALASALEEVLNSSEMQARLSAGARTLALRFDWPGIAADTATFFESVLA